MPKLCSLEELKNIRSQKRRERKIIVFTNGCFDLLHRGHIQLFKEARSLGDNLFVAVNDDDSLSRLKGPSRPIFPLAERLEVLEAIAYIDYLVVFDEDTPQHLIADLVPDVLVKGGDWQPEEVVGKREVEEAGGQVVIVPYLEGYSSSSIIERIVLSQK
jgi:D-beta-D-heptose 7-phosphate kinase/D-beta-D-heptose 1-phosphate adenosyltransferase